MEKSRGKSVQCLSYTLIMLDNELLDPYQSAYKPQHGTETALLKVKNDMLCALYHNRKAVFLILLYRFKCRFLHS